MPTQLFSRKHYLRTLLIGTFFLWPSAVGATMGCGYLIGPADYFSYIEATTTTAINDCSDPFGANRNPTPFELRLAQVLVSTGANLVIPEGGTTDYSFHHLRSVYDERHAFYRHEGNDLVFVGMWPRPPREADARVFASIFFSPEIDTEPYISVWLGDIVDPNTYNSDLYDQFYYAFYAWYTPEKPLLIPGRYTLLSEEFVITLGRESRLLRHFEMLIKTAYAQTIPPRHLFTLTFDFEAEAPAKAGTSNILFVPGLLGTRLYETSAECDSGRVIERERWFSRSACAQRRLKTTLTGQSINEIYTKPGTAALLDKAGAFGVNFNIYKSFLADLEAWRQSGQINDYAVLPYDWRLSLDNLMTAHLNEGNNQIKTAIGHPFEESYLYQTVATLASTSRSGRVTVVTHSNGGLLMKFFLSQLASNNDSLLTKVDNLILVAVPQFGTPEAVLGLLHGAELNFVMAQSDARFLLNTMPAAHHLLPSEYYFSNNRGAVGTPVISFEAGSITTPLREQFGPQLDSWSKLRNFLAKESGRPVPTETDLLTPQVVDAFLLNYARTTSALINSWQPPATMKVYQIAGTGLPTPTGLTYFTDRACVRRSLFRCTEYADKLGYRANLTLAGDGTVVVPSALAMVESNWVERWWVDLFTYNDDNFPNRSHRNLLEVEDIRDLTLNIAKNSHKYEYEYLSTLSPPIADDSLVFQLHSPLDLSVRLTDGLVVGSSSPSVRNVSYRRFGELQYVVVPAEEVNTKVELVGQDEGSFTLEIEEYRDGQVVRQKTLSAIPSILGTKVILPVESPGTLLAEAVVLAVDYDGDGMVDVKYDQLGIVEAVYTYQDLRSLTRSWSLPSARSRVLLTLLEVAERLGKRTTERPISKAAERAALLVLDAKLRQYEARRWITRSQYDTAKVMINYLLK